MALYARTALLHDGALIEIDDRLPDVPEELAVALIARGEACDPDRCHAQVCCGRRAEQAKPTPKPAARRRKES